jgi:hypothetical protein
LNTSFLSLEDVREFVGDFAYDLLVTRRLDRLLAEDSREDFHEVEGAVLVFGVVGVAEDAATQFEIPLSELERTRKSLENLMADQRASTYHIARRKIRQLPNEDVDQNFDVVRVEERCRFGNAEEIHQHLQN